MASLLGVYPSLVWSVRAYHKKTGKLPEPKRPGRPKRASDPDAAKAILDAYARNPVGVQMLTQVLKRNNPQIS